MPLNKVSLAGNSFMYLRAILCTFQISVDFYYRYVPVSGRGGGRGGAGEGEGARERGENEYCMGTVIVLTVPMQLLTHTVSVLTVPTIF